VKNDPSVGSELESILGQRGTQDIPGEFLQPRAIPRPDASLGVQIEAIASLTDRRILVLVVGRLSEEPHHALPASGTHRQNTLEARPIHTREPWLRCRHRVLIGLLRGVLPESAAYQQLTSSTAGFPGDVRDLLMRGGRKLVEGDGAIEGFLDKSPVGDQKRS
jgi:hypothetical protein